MSRFLKSLHLTALSFGFLAVVAIICNLVMFSILYPQVTQLLEQQPNWETYGIVAVINITVIAFYQLFSVLALLAQLISQRKTSFMIVAAITIGIISGLMVVGDISLLSDIGSEYQAGWQTRGEWWILFGSYGLHILSLVLGILSLIGNLKEEERSEEQVLKDEVLFFSLHSTGVICGALGLIGVAAGLFSQLSLWMMERIVVVLSSLVLAPYLVILTVWLFRHWFGESSPILDEKQFQDLANAGLWTLIIMIPSMIIFFGFQLSFPDHRSWTVLWLPLLIFFSLAIFSSITMRYFREYR